LRNGKALDLMEDFIGESYMMKGLEWTGPSEAWKDIYGAVRDGRPACCGTPASLGRTEGMVGDHNYPIVDAFVDPQKGRMLRLRNVWGHEEFGDDGRNDGIFELPFERFSDFFATYSYVGASRRRR
jgi:hypothetical protein